MSENIITWDFMGWRETQAPDVGVQLEWNKTLITKFTEISKKLIKTLWVLVVLILSQCIHH